MTQEVASMREAGRQRYLDRQQKLVRQGAASERDDRSSIIRDNLLDFADRLNAMIDKDEAQQGRASKVLLKVKSLEATLIAYISLSTILSFMGKDTDKYKMAARIGVMLENEAKLHYVSESEPELLKRLIRYSKKRGTYRHKLAFVLNTASKKEGVSLPEEWSVKDRAFVGTVMLNIAEEMDLITITTTTKNNYSRSLISLSDSVKDWLDDYRTKAEAGSLPMITPVFAPTTEVPLDWDSPVGGGYRGMVYPLVKKSHSGINAAYGEADMSKVYASVNLMQRTPWHINPVMFAIVEALWAQGVTVGKLPRGVRVPVPERIPNEQWEDMDEVERKGHQLTLASAHETNIKVDADLAFLSMALSQARNLVQAPKIYIPYQLDYRGRAYCMPILNPQGADYMRAMFEFAEGKPVGDRGGMWLALQVASLWDGEFHGKKLSKSSFQERHDWAEENEEFIRSVVADPLGNTEWHKADKPFMFLRTAMDLVGYWDVGPDFVSHVPIALDGSCSGIQHYAALLRDSDCARSVNLVETNEPSDVYGEVAEAVQSAVLLDNPMDTPTTEEESDGTIQAVLAAPADCGMSPRDFWLRHGITRKVVKTPVMTYGYSSREAGFTEKYETSFVRPALKAMGLHHVKSNPIARYLAQHTLAAVETRLAPVAKAMDWTMTCAELLAREGKGISWTAPSGFPVAQKYMDTPSVRVETYLEGEKLRVSIPGVPKKINLLKQKSAISPNYIHSLDAAHLMLTVREAHSAHGITNFSLIHDSFGTLAADTDAMFMAVRDAFVTMYENSEPLEDLYKRVYEDLSEKGRKKLPKPPAKGDLDLDSVRQSLYAFS